MNKVYIIYGPTSSGKTAKAIEMAKNLDGEVISADSRQIYRGLDLATGKVSHDEMDGIPHHLLDIRNPGQNYSAGQFKIDAEKIIDEIIESGKTPIVAGGTAFYLQTLMSSAIYPDAPIDPKLRTELSQKSIPELNQILDNFDSKSIDKVNRQNPARIIRAIEILNKLGHIPDIKYDQPKYEFEKIILDLDNDILYPKIKNRIMQRLNDGMLEEILGAKLRFNVPWEWFEKQGLELGNGALFHTGQISIDEFIDKTFNETKDFVKRQRTWGKKL